MKDKIPLILVFGFLGSGKTTFLNHFLAHYAGKKKIAVVQNEFAQANIDESILKEDNSNFLLENLNTGSIFCVCLFSKFKDTLIDIYENHDIDMVIVEASGIADPIAVAQLMDDQGISEKYYLSQILTIVDSYRIDILSNIISTVHQIQVADKLLVNKIDLVNDSKLSDITRLLKQTNPFAEIYCASHSSFDIDKIMNNNFEHTISRGKIEGELTKCKKNYITKIYKTSSAVSKTKILTLMNGISKDILRLKGFFTDKDGNSFLLQYVPGNIEIIPCKNYVGMTEIISIGYCEPNFEMLD